MTTVLNDVILPERIMLAGIRGRNLRMNQRAMNQAGFMQVNQIWAQTLRRYELGFAPMTVADQQTIVGLHEVTEGGAYGFLMLDPTDRTVTAADGYLRPYISAGYVGTSGAGYGVPVYRTHKRYTSVGSTRTKDRRVSRPKATISVTRGGAAVAVGSGAGEIGINYDTGAVTFVADASQAMSGITPGATTVLTFASGAGMVAAMSVGQRVYLSGVSGTAASTLNGLSHEVTAKGASSLTIATSTSGLTASSGTAYKYPQANEALRWAGTFYVPVQFEADELEWELVCGGDFSTRMVTTPNCVLQEIRE